MSVASERDQQSAADAAELLEALLLSKRADLDREIEGVESSIRWHEVLILEGREQLGRLLRFRDDLIEAEADL